MELADRPVEDPRESISSERDDLLALLEDLSDDDWVAPTEAGVWRVKDVALHLLDDGLLPTHVDHREFVRSLDAKNERWVAGARDLSRRVVIDLLRWSGREVDDFDASIDLEGTQPRLLDVERLCATVVRPVP